MRTRTLAAAAALLAAVLTASCSHQPTQAEIQQKCVDAIKARPSGDKAKPKACEPLSDDDYNTLVMDQVLHGMGWVDKDGNLDKQKMLDDATATPQ